MKRHATAFVTLLVVLSSLAGGVGHAAQPPTVCRLHGDQDRGFAWEPYGEPRVHMTASGSCVRGLTRYGATLSGEDWFLIDPQVMGTCEGGDVLKLTARLKLTLKSRGQTIVKIFGALWGYLQLSEINQNFPPSPQLGVIEDEQGRGGTITLWTRTAGKCPPYGDNSATYEMRFSG